MEASKNGLERIVTAVERLRDLEAKVGRDIVSASKEEKTRNMLKDLVVKYETAMEDDFNTADAISAIFEMVKLANTDVDENSSKELVSDLKEEIEILCDVLGIKTERKQEVLDSEIEELIAKRQAARKAKDFALADEIRGTLLNMGIVLEDTREGVKWKRV